ncbi:putative amastin [Trypanosoma rangeli]|uniref:Putative amastin n=1 Tax=Trypanosoma rangeli TaxID=5698 RepID=A0A3R7N3S7_TRYRA|nr:putative amastin [Trypanosoma rangeli]RNE99637.1 putative amastin [Trypanosoma rangeli]|eukprot:RNE99637.1 putative amastin [Trypanosoma rangeli]
MRHQAEKWGSEDEAVGGDGKKRTALPQHPQHPQQATFEAATSFASLRRDLSQKPRDTGAGDRQAVTSGVALSHDGNPKFMARRIRFFDDISTSSSSFSAEAREPAGSNEESPMSGEALSMEAKKPARSNEEGPMSREALSTEAKKPAGSNEEGPMSREALSTEAKKPAGSNEEGPMSREALSTEAKKPAGSNEEGPMSREALSMEAKKPARSNEESPMRREWLRTPKESVKAEENKERAFWPAPPSFSTHDAASAFATPVGFNQVNPSFNNPVCDVLPARAEVNPTFETKTNDRQGGPGPPRGRENARDDDGVLRMCRTIKKRLEDMWEFGGDTDTRLLVMLLSTALAFVLTVVGAPLSQVDVVGGACYTYWGYKEDCDSSIYTNRTSLITCEPVRKRLQVGAAFSIMTIIVLLFAVVCCGLLLRHDLLKLRLFVLLLLFIAFVFQMISWAAVASMFGSWYCEDARLPRRTAYGVAFGMTLTSWFFIIGGGLACALLHVY